MDKIAIAFPGQGAQYVGMGESFFKNYIICRQTFEEASDISGVDMEKLCFKGPVTKLNHIEEMQLAVTTVNLAIARAYFYEYGIFPQFAFGHSVGEYAALSFAGAVRFSDVIRMLVFRGQLLREYMEQHDDTMMVAENIDCVSLEELILKQNLKDEVFISSYNSEKQLLISGTSQGIGVLAELLLDIGARITPMLSPPMHSPLLSSVAENFRAYLDGIRYFPFYFPIISNLTGKPFSEPAKIPDMLARHLKQPVFWEASVRCCERYGISMIVEAGPKNIVTNLIKAITPELKLFCYGQKSDRQSINELLAGDSGRQKDVPEFIGRCLGIAVSTKNSCRDASVYREGVSESYRTLKKMQEQVRENNSHLTQEDMIKAISLLKTILMVKKVDQTEQESWFKALLDETNTYYLLAEEV